MKRECSPSPTPTPQNEPRTPPTSTAKKSKSSSHEVTPSKSTPGGSVRSKWTSDQRYAVLEAVIAAGVKNVDMDALAEEIGVTKSQLVDQLKPNRANLRSQALRLFKSKSE